MTTIDQRKEEIVKKFKNFESWEDRYRQLIHYGKTLSKLSDEEKIDENLVPGCLSRVWLHHEYDGENVTFKADSDAAITKGIIGVLVFVYSGSTPEQVLKTAPDFLQEIGINDHLSMNRRNGLANMCKIISACGLKYIKQTQ